LNLLQLLYADYKANPNATTLHKIQNVISDLNHNLPHCLNQRTFQIPLLQPE